MWIAAEVGPGRKEGRGRSITAWTRLCSALTRSFVTCRLPVFFRIWQRTSKFPSRMADTVSELYRLLALGLAFCVNRGSQAWRDLDSTTRPVSFVNREVTSPGRNGGARV